MRLLFVPITVLWVTIHYAYSQRRQVSFLHPPPSPLSIKISFISPDDGSINFKTIVIEPSSARNVPIEEKRMISQKVRVFCTAYSSTEALEECVGNVLDAVYSKFPHIAERRDVGFFGGTKPRHDVSMFCSSHSNAPQTQMFYSSDSDPIRCEQNLLNELGYDIPVKPLNQHKVVLFWKKVYLESSSLKASWQGNHIYKQCEYSKCWNTVDRKELSRADAVWFYCTNLPESEEPYPEPWNDTNFPTRVYSCLESPIMATHGTKNPLEPSHRVFDWTMTLNQDSTINPSWYYTPNITNGGLRSLLTRSTSTEFQIPHKKNLVAWTVSNCETASNRESKAKKLSLALRKIGQRLDIFGSKDCMSPECVPGKRKSCPDKDIAFPECPKDTRTNPDKECVERVLSSYYFYLSWENSICEDYVTEKFYNALRLGVIPVVLEGDWYDRLVPEGYDVFIRVSDYDTFEDLASRLVEIAKNRTLYESYFKWREISLKNLSPRFIKHVLNAESPWCDLCRKLHEGNHDAKKNSVDISEWYGVENRCKEGQDTCCWF
ncbi:glycosyltransferase family 10 fucosyltransferase [bacterium]|nr:glycosyltransferase family 10 fucosyltransferase [bacterium]